MSSGAPAEVHPDCTLQKEFKKRITIIQSANPFIFLYDPHPFIFDFFSSTPNVALWSVSLKGNQIPYPHLGGKKEYKILLYALLSEIVACFFFLLCFMWTFVILMSCLVFHLFCLILLYFLILRILFLLSQLHFVVLRRILEYKKYCIKLRIITKRVDISSLFFLFPNTPRTETDEKTCFPFSHLSLLF